MSRISSTTGRGALRRRLVGVAGAAATVAVVGALTLAAPLSASADDRPESYAKGQFLSGTVLGTDLGKALRVEYAEAHNDGGQGSQTDKDPFAVTALDSLTVGGGQSAQLGLGDFLQLGAVDQYAQARGDGSSTGASGAVTNDGGIQTNRNGSGTPADATFDLSKLLGSQFASSLADLKLELGAISAQANGDLNQASGDYQLANAKLRFSSPAISQLTDKVDTALDSVDTNLAGLGGADGLLSQQLGRLLPLSGTGLVLGKNVQVSATIDTGDLKAAVHDLLTAEFTSAGVDADLENGTVSIDLAKLVGGNLNDLAPGTELIDDKIIDQVLDSITSQVASISDQVVAKVKELLNSAKVTITAHAAVSVPQSVTKTVCKTVQHVIPGSSSSGTGSTGGSAGSGSGNPVGGLVGGLLGGVSGAVGTPGSGGSIGGVVGQVGDALGQVVNQTLCGPVTTILPSKLTSLDVNLSGSVKQLIAGGSTNAAIDLKVLDLVNANIDTAAVVKGLGSTLADQLFGTDGTIGKLTTALQNGLVHPAVEGLVGPGTGPVSDALTKLISVKVNLQETSTPSAKGMAAQAGRLFTETAVRVTVLGGVGGSSLATVNLGQATVGPNITTVVNPPSCTGGTCDPATCTVAPCGPGSNPPGILGSAANRLATTGISIAALVAAMLALLAAGAYLVREGYQRRKSTPVV